MSPRVVSARLADVRKDNLLLVESPRIKKRRDAAITACAVARDAHLAYGRQWMTSPDGSAPMHSVGIATGHVAGAALPITEHEEVARGCEARLLISASSERVVATLARRIHEAGARAQCPFLHLSAGDFPVEPQALREYCSSVLDRAAGGSLLIDAVEEMPPTVQEVLIELLAGLALARAPSAAVRLISGTTVSLLDRIAAGTFSDQLFYRLNIIHLMAADSPFAEGEGSNAVRVR